ncbi:O-antigen polysaccharide polymerase Wzy [Bacillus thuringiensis]
MRLKKPNKLLLIFFYLGYFCIAWWILQQTESFDYKKWLSYMTGLAFLTIFIQLLTAKYLRIKTISIAGMFIIFSYVFHFGHLFLLAIDYSFPDLSYGVGLYRYGEDIYRKAMNFSMLSMLSLFLGMMIAKKPTEKITENLNNDIKSNDNYKNYYGILGFILLCISFPIDLYLLFNQIKQMGTGGYSSVHEFGVNLGLRYLSYLVNPAFFLLIVANKNTKWNAKLILAFYIIYKFITMFTGMRAYAILNILIMVYLYHSSVKKFSRKFMIWGSAIGYFILSLFIAIRNTRSYGLSFERIYEGLLSNEGSPIMGTLEEFGMTINVVCEVVSRVSSDSFIDYANGMQIVTSIMSAIPFVSNIFSNIDFADYNLIDKLDIWHLGGSYIADFYFDFGTKGIFAIAFYGFLVQLFSQYIENNLKQMNYYKVAMFIPAGIDIIFSVRSTITKIPRVLIWIPIFMALLEKLLVRKKHRLREDHKNINCFPERRELDD